MPEARVTSLERRSRQFSLPRRCIEKLNKDPVRFSPRAIARTVSAGRYPVIPNDARKQPTLLRTISARSIAHVELGIFSNPATVVLFRKSTYRCKCFSGCPNHRVLMWALENFSCSPMNITSIPILSSPFCQSRPRLVVRDLDSGDSDRGHARRLHARLST